MSRMFGFGSNKREVKGDKRKHLISNNNNIECENDSRCNSISAGFSMERSRSSVAVDSTLPTSDGKLFVKQPSTSSTTTSDKHSVVRKKKNDSGSGHRRSGRVGVSGSPGSPLFSRDQRTFKNRMELIQAKNLSFVFGVPDHYVVTFLFITMLLLGFDHKSFRLYGNFSVLLLIAPVMVLFFYLMVKLKKKNKHNAIMLCTEPQLLSLVMQEMPKWFHYKDVEQVNWFNTIIQQLWPYIDSGVSKVIKEKYAAGLLEKIPGVRVELSEITLGSSRPPCLCISLSIFLSVYSLYNDHALLPLLFIIHPPAIPNLVCFFDQPYPSCDDDATTHTHTISFHIHALM
jgi:Ca2+-dependent lipid-binding protein